MYIRVEGTENLVLLFAHELIAKNIVSGHRTGSGHPGVEDYIRET